jgi:hypothetical protein
MIALEYAPGGALSASRKETKMKKRVPKLILSKETLRSLDSFGLGQVAAGGPTNTNCNTCQISCYTDCYDTCLC